MIGTPVWSINALGQQVLAQIIWDTGRRSVTWTKIVDDHENDECWVWAEGVDDRENDECWVWVEGTSSVMVEAP